jgi:hypothetical protein
VLSTAAAGAAGAAVDTIRAAVNLLHAALLCRLINVPVELYTQSLQKVRDM